MVNAKYDSGKARNTLQSLTSASKGFMLSSDSASSLDVPEFPYAGYVSSLPGLIDGYGKTCELDIEWAILPVICPRVRPKSRPLQVKAASWV